MIPPTYQMRPLLCTWADTRDVAGELAGAAGVWVPGIWPSWCEAISDPAGSGACWSGTLPTPSSWGWRDVPTIGQRWTCIDGKSQTLPSPLTDQLFSDGGKFLSDRLAIYPSRSLRADPVPVDALDGGVTVTLGGITRRNTYSQRRQWVIDLLLDGALDVAAGAGQVTTAAPDAWRQFVAHADLGVTIYLYGEAWPVPGSLGPVWAYAGAPNRISGALVDATNIRWSPPQTGILSRYEVTITIAEVTAPGRLV